MEAQWPHGCVTRAAHFVAPALAILCLAIGKPSWAAGDPARGRNIAGLWCSPCHQISPNFPERGPGPPFAAIAGNLRYSATYIRDWVVYPHATMPNFAFSRQVLDDIVAYIHSLRGDNPPECEPCTAPSADRRFARGTGFFVGGGGHVLTVDHNVRSCTRVTVEMPGAFTAEASVASQDAATDLALLKVDIRPGAFVRVRWDSELQLGERVVSFSYPLSGTLSSGGNLEAGHVAALKGINDRDSEFQMSANLQLGSSGGPVMDGWGRVVGVAKSRLIATTAGDLPPHGVNFAVDTRAIRLFLATSGVPASAGDRGQMLELVAIAALARTFTVRVTCWR